MSTRVDPSISRSQVIVKRVGKFTRGYDHCVTAAWITRVHYYFRYPNQLISEDVRLIISSSTGRRGVHSYGRHYIWKLLRLSETSTYIVRRPTHGPDWKDRSSVAAIISL